MRLMYLRLKNWKMEELRNSETNKQLAPYRWSFWMLKYLKKCNNAVLRGCERRRKVQRMYLAFKNLNIKRK